MARAVAAFFFLTRRGAHALGLKNSAPMRFAVPAPSAIGRQGGLGRGRLSALSVFTDGVNPRLQGSLVFWVDFLSANADRLFRACAKKSLISLGFSRGMHLG
jgi:hypothetical protein